MEEVKSINLDEIHSELKYFFEPRTVAVIGASHDPEKVGYGVLKGLVEGGMFSVLESEGFQGSILAINPKREEILGVKCYPSLLNAPEKADLAIICIPAKYVPQAVKDCRDTGVKAVIIISAGFGETGEEGLKLQNEFLKIAREGKLRIVGPNCLGILYPPNSLNASFGPALPPSGSVAFISQSGALADSVIDWSLKERYGFSAVISYGNKADLDAPDFLAWAAKDTHTKAVAVYIEGLNDGRYSLNVAKEVSKVKPIIVMKAGRGLAGTKAVSSHTGSLAGAYDVYKGAFKQAGVIVADNLTEMFNISKALALQQPAEGDRVAIVTNGGGCGVMCADYCEISGLKLPQPSEEIIRRLDSTGKLHPAWSRHNPFDVVGDASPECYRLVLEEVMSSGLYDGAIVIQTLQTMTDTMADAETIVRINEKYKKPVVTSFMKGAFTEKGVEYLEAHGIPNYGELRQAVKCMWALVERGKYLRKVKG